MKKFFTIDYFFGKPWAALLVILIVCSFSYYNIVDNDFIGWDDDKQITDNSYVKTLNWENIQHNLLKERYTFISLTTFSILYHCWGENPVPFHTLSILIHLLNVTLAFYLARKLTKNNYSALFVALLFALHPMRVESVAWISELKDLLFTCFALSSFIFYIKYLKTELKPVFFMIAALFAFLSAFSKIQGLIVPFSFFLFDIYYNRKLTFSYFLEKIVLFLAVFFIFKLIHSYLFYIFSAIILLSFRKVKKILIGKEKYVRIIGFMLGAIILFVGSYYIANSSTNLWSALPNKYHDFSSFERLFLAGFALWFYVFSFFWPTNFNAVHPYPQRLTDGTFPQEYYFTAIALCFFVLFSVYIIIKRKKILPVILFGWLFFLLNISLVLHVVPIEGRLVVADRYSYLAYFGLFIFIAGFIENMLLQREKLKKYFVILFSAILILFSAVTYSRSMVWKDTITLFTDVLKKNPKIPFAYLNIGGAYLNNRSPNNALIYLNESVKQDSLDPAAYFNRALAFFMSGQPDAAISDFNKVIHLSTTQTEKALVYTNMGEIYQKTGKDSLALEYYLKSIEMDSSIAASYNNRGLYYFKAKELIKAFRDFDKAISLDPDYADAWNNRGWALTAQGNFEEALKNFDRSLSINPNYAMALNNRGYLKYKTNDFQGALSDYNKALQLDTGLIEGYLNRGWVYSSSGNYKMAIEDYSVVLKKNKKQQTALTNRAFARFYMKDFKNASIDFEDVVKYYPNSAINHQNLGWFKMQVKDNEKAIEEFEISVKLDPSLVNSYLNLGWIWMEKKNLNKAEIYYNKALAIDSENGEVLFWLGELNRKTKKSEACDYYNKSALTGNIQAKKALQLYCLKQF